MVAAFSVIFLGITLSLLADDWRQQLADREDEVRALEELLADLRADSADLEDLRRQMARHDRDAMWVFQRLGQSGVDADSAIIRLRSIHNLSLYQAPRATYAGLRSTGRLVLIQDEVLRRDIIRYYEERQPYLVQFYEAYGDVWSQFGEAEARDTELFYPAGSESFYGGSGFRLTRPWRDVSNRSALRIPHQYARGAGLRRCGESVRGH